MPRKVSSIRPELTPVVFGLPPALGNRYYTLQLLLEVKATGDHLYQTWSISTGTVVDSERVAYNPIKLW